MKKLIARLMVMSLLAVSLAAFAQTGSDAGKDNMQQPTPTGPRTPKANKSHTMDPGKTKKNSMSKGNTTKKSTAKTDTTKTDAAKKKDDSAPKQ